MITGQKKMAKGPNLQGVGAFLMPCEMLYHLDGRRRFFGYVVGYADNALDFFGDPFGQLLQTVVGKLGGRAYFGVFLSQHLTSICRP